MESFTEFAARVHSYKIPYWPMRHYKLTPPKCARWGFKCVDSVTLQCTSCEHIISMSNYPIDVEGQELRGCWILKIVETLFHRFVN